MLNKMSNNTNQSNSKPSSYINVAADVNFLQRIICCNHDIGNNVADTPRGHREAPKSEAPKSETPKSKSRRFNFAEEVEIRPEDA